jgi:hypothetical protein
MVISWAVVRAKGAGVAAKAKVGVVAADAVAGAVVAEAVAVDSAARVISKASSRTPAAAGNLAASRAVAAAVVAARLNHQVAAMGENPPAAAMVAVEILPPFHDRLDVSLSTGFAKEREA